MLSIYLTLVHRIEGIGLSLNDFWEMDTWTTSMFYLTELALIEEEKKASKKGSKFSSNEYEVEENEEVRDLYEEMFVDESSDY